MSTTCDKPHDFLCGRCLSKSYCCADHQKQDWPQHRAVCAIGLPTDEPDDDEETFSSGWFVQGTRPGYWKRMSPIAANHFRKAVSDLALSPEKEPSEKWTEDGAMFDIARDPRKVLYLHRWISGKDGMPTNETWRIAYEVPFAPDHTGDEGISISPVRRGYATEEALLRAYDTRMGSLLEGSQPFINATFVIQEAPWEGKPVAFNPMVSGKKESFLLQERITDVNQMKLILEAILAAGGVTPWVQIDIIDGRTLKLRMTQQVHGRKEYHQSTLQLHPNVARDVPVVWVEKLIDL